MDTLILRGGHVLDPASGIDEPRDVVLADGAVVELLAPGGRAKGRAIDVRGLLVAPGFIDIHVHLREPGFEYKETIATGARAAVAGGITAVVAMPNTNPPPDNADMVRGFMEKARGAACRVYTVGTITVGRKGETLSEIGELADAGVVGLSDDGSPVKNARVLLNAMEYARPFGIPIVCHCEDLDLAASGHMNEGIVSAELGVRGIPNIAESLDVERSIVLARYAAAKVHICHVSAAESVEAIRRGKRDPVGATISAETAPHYLALTDDTVRTFDGNAKMNPPLRTRADQEALFEGLRDGTIDAIATDHAPHAPEEKVVEFDAAPNGIIGLETSVGVVWTHVVGPGILTPFEVVRKMAANPARIHGLPGGTLAPGSPADITVIDPARRWIVAEPFRSTSRNSPFVGAGLTGKAVLTIVGGLVRHDEDGRIA